MELVYLDFFFVFCIILFLKEIYFFCEVGLEKWNEGNFIFVLFDIFKVRNIIFCEVNLKSEMNEIYRDL